MSICSCKGQTLDNTGAPGCIISQGVPVGPMLQQTKDSDGNINEIDLPTYTGSQAQWDGFTQNLDLSLRIFPLFPMKNVQDVRGDDRTESFEDESIEVIGEGLRRYTAVMTEGASPMMAAQLDSYKCVQFSMYLRDDCGGLTGKRGSTDDKFRGIRVNRKTWSARYVKPTATTVAKVIVTFEFNSFERDEDLRTIEAGLTEINLLEDVEGLANVSGAVTLPVVGGATLTATFDNGSAVLQPYEGLLSADIKLDNITTATLDIAVVAVESPAGTYVYTHAAQLIGNIMEISFIDGNFELRKIRYTVA